MKRFVDILSQRWKALKPGQRLAFLAGLVTVTVVVAFTMARLNTQDWAVLYANVDDKTASEVMAKLDANGVPHKLDGNGTRILVPRDQLATTRLALAGEGITGQPVPDGFEEIFASQGLATSDFEQRVNYERALEGELARTLLAMEPVDGANVQLSLPERSVFVGSGPEDQGVPTASVLLSLRRPLTQSEVDTVANLVAASVEGLSTNQVTIASTDGGLLKAPGESTDSVAGNTAKAVEHTREYEQQLATRLTSLARAMTGTAGATVEVRADFDYTQQTVESQVLDPEANVPTAEHTVSETWTGSGVNPGTVGVDGGPLGPGDGTGEGEYVHEERTTTWDNGNKTITRSQSTSPTIKRLSVAVVVPVPVTTDADGNVTDAASLVDASEVERVISSAAGLDLERGDTIEVAVVNALSTDDGSLMRTPVEATVVPGTSPMMFVAAAVGGAALMFLLGRVRRRRAKRKAPAEPGDVFSRVVEATPAETKGKAKPKKGKSGAPEPTVVVPVAAGAAAAAAGAAAGFGGDSGVDAIRADLERIVNESPESLAALLGTWMTK
jgi:flagellar M-ring protein FliF